MAILAFIIIGVLILMIASGGALMWIALIIGISFFTWLILSSNNDLKKEEKYAKKEKINFYAKASYKGGFPDTAVNENSNKNNMYLKVKDNKVIISKEMEAGTVKFLSKENLVDAEIMTKERITQEVNTGKLLVFGLLGFGMTDTKTQNINYLVITYRDDDKNRQVVFYIDQNDKLEETTRRIRSIIRAA